MPGQKRRQALGREHGAGSPERYRYLTPRKSTRRFGPTMQRCVHRTFTKIMAWAKAHHQRDGRWPSVRSGWVRDVPGETWNGVNQALTTGTRGLAGGSPSSVNLEMARFTCCCFLRSKSLGNHGPRFRPLALSACGLAKQADQSAL